MVLSVLTDEELSDLTSYLSSASYIYYPIATDYFHDLYVTGCRPMELLTVSNWSFNGIDTYTLQPLKGNNLRYFTSADLSNSLKEAIQLQIDPYHSLSYRQLKSVLYKIIPVVIIMTEKKNAIEYMFRYNRVKEDYKAGMSYADITTKFGWVSLMLAYSYNIQTLYKLGDLPVFVNFGLIDSDGTFLITETGTYITSQ
jgi:hypothetical protein